MASLSQVRANNAALRTRLGPGLVAVFAGGTSGIGETTARELVRNVDDPRVYIVGRNEKEANRIIDEFRKITPKGDYKFVAGDLAKLREVDRVCEEIRTLEDRINLLVVSQGILKPGGPNDAGDGIDRKVALHYYSRIRMIVNLLPLLKKASQDHACQSLARVVSCLAAGRENAKLNYDDLALRKSYGVMSAEAHACTMMTMALEHLASENPEISFIHKFPGIVHTNIFRTFNPIIRYTSEAIMATLARPFTVSVKESGERFLYTCTSERFPPKERAQEIKPAEGEVEVGTNGQRGSGAYPVTWNDKRTMNENSMKVHRDQGGIEKVWNHTMKVFETVCEKKEKFEGDA